MPLGWTPMPLRMSASHLGRISDELAFEPQRENNGLIVVYGQYGWGWPVGVGTDAAITLSLESFDLPTETNAVLEMHYMNELQKAPSKGRLEDFEVTIKDSVDQEVAAALLQWRRRVYNPTLTGGGLPGPGLRKISGQGGLGLCRDFKTSADILLMGPNGGFQRSYSLDGVWPSSLKHGQIDMRSEAQVMLTITLQADRIYDHDMRVGEAYPD